MQAHYRNCITGLTHSHTPDQCMLHKYPAYQIDQSDCRRVLNNPQLMVPATHCKLQSTDTTQTTEYRGGHAAIVLGVSHQ